jgi:hypothetical protein
MGRVSRALAETIVRVSANSIVLAKRMPAKAHAKVMPLHVIAVVLLLLMCVGTRPARLSATKIILALLKTAKTHVTVTKKLAVALILNLNASSKLVRTSARSILFAKKIPLAEIHV